MFQIHITLEKWKKIEYNDTVYKVSSLGRIKRNNKIISQNVSESGYFIVDSKRGYVFVHKLVAMAFLNKRDNDGLTVDHIDSNKRNNTVKNLELVTAQENQRRASEKLRVWIKNKKIDTNIKVQAYDKNFNTIDDAFTFYKENINPKSKISLNNFYLQVTLAIQKNMKFAHTLWTKN